MTYQRLIATVLALLPLTAVPVRAAVRLGAPFGDHMVLQQGAPVAIWGTGCPGGDTVRVSIAGQSVTAKSDWEGRWIVQLAPMKAGGPYQMLIEIGGNGPIVPSPAANTKGGAELNDVLIGELVLASAPYGSNVSHTVVSTEVPSNNGASQLAANPYAWVRVFKAPSRRADDPPNDTAGQWTFVSQDTVYTDSAALFSAGREAYNRLHIPIGIIDTSNGPICSQAEHCTAPQDNPPTPSN